MTITIRPAKRLRRRFLFSLIFFLFFLPIFYGVLRYQFGGQNAFFSLFLPLEMLVIVAVAWTWWFRFLARARILLGRHSVYYRGALRGRRIPRSRITRVRWGLRNGRARVEFAKQSVRFFMPNAYDFGDYERLVRWLREKIEPSRHTGWDRAYQRDFYELPAPPTDKQRRLDYWAGLGRIQRVGIPLLVCFSLMGLGMWFTVSETTNNSIFNPSPGVALTPTQAAAQAQWQAQMAQSQTRQQGMMRGNAAMQFMLGFMMATSFCFGAPPETSRQKRLRQIPGPQTLDWVIVLSMFQVSIFCCVWWSGYWAVWWILIGWGGALAALVACGWLQNEYLKEIDLQHLENQEIHVGRIHKMPAELRSSASIAARLWDQCGPISTACRRGGRRLARIASPVAEFCRRNMPTLTKIFQRRGRA